MDKEYDKMNDEMEDALRRLGQGGKLEEVHTEELIDPETGNVRQIKCKRTTKTVRPDYRALIFWLTNRRSKNWATKVSADPEAPVEWRDEDWHDGSEEHSEHPD